MAVKRRARIIKTQDSAFDLTLALAENETVLRFVQSQRDEIALKNAIMLVHIDPLSLETEELHRPGSENEPFEI